MKALALTLVVIGSVLAGSVGGGVAGYYVAIMTPSASSIVVLDVESLAARVDPKSTDYAGQAALLASKARQVTERLTAAGIVVLDRAAVIAAPDDSIVRVDLVPRVVK
jgi:hypothetical protein